MNLGSGGNQSKLRNGWFEKNDVRVVQEMVYSPTCADLSMAGQAKGIKTVLKERGLWDDGFKLPHARGFLSQQPDFLEQKSMVEELFATTDHRAIFLPKFHCEFNFIEMYWGAIKYYCRANCNYTFASLLPTVHKAMAHVTLATIRRFARKCWRYMDAYRQGLPMEAAEWAVKQQRSHRRINMSLLK